MGDLEVLGDSYLFRRLLGSTLEAFVGAEVGGLVGSIDNEGLFDGNEGTSDGTA